MNTISKSVIIASSLLFAVFAAGCAKDHQPSSYAADGIGQVRNVAEGVILDVQNVHVAQKSTKTHAAPPPQAAIPKPQPKPFLGENIHSDVMGGDNASVDNRRTLATLFGGGGKPHEFVSHKPGIQYIVKLSPSHRIVSIVQGPAPILKKGEHVWVIFGSKIRLIPNTSA